MNSIFGTSSRNWLLVIGLLVGFVPSTAFSHPFHICVGQMRWNASTKIWEVSLRLHPQDLEAAMSNDLARRGQSKKISTEDPKFPEMAVDYLASRFVVRRTPSAVRPDELKVMLRVEELQRTSTDPKNPEMDAVAPDENSLSKCKWVGMESEKGWLWIHLEMQMPSIEPGKQRLWMINRILMDHVDKQENSVTIDPVIAPKYSLQFKKGEEFQAVRPHRSI